MTNLEKIDIFEKAGADRSYSDGFQKMDQPVVKNITVYVLHYLNTKHCHI